MTGKLAHAARAPRRGRETLKQVIVAGEQRVKSSHGAVVDECHMGASQELTERCDAEGDPTGIGAREDVAEGPRLAGCPCVIFATASHSFAGGGAAIPPALGAVDTDRARARLTREAVNRLRDGRRREWPTRPSDRIK